MRKERLQRGLAAVVPVAFGLCQAGEVLAGDTYGANSSSSVVVAPVVSKEGAQQSTGLISERIAHAIANATSSGGTHISPVPGGVNPQTSSSESGNGEAGMAAGDAPKRWAMWANASNTWLSGDLPGADFKGTIIDSLIGMDYFVTDNLLIGMVAGYESAKMTSSFNGGKLHSAGFALAPYGAYMINDTFYVDGTIGVTSVNYRTSRDDGQINGKTSGLRWFTALNLNASMSLGGYWRLVDTIGFMYVSEDQDAYTETDGSSVDAIKVRLGQFRNTVNLGYRIPMEFGHITPYGLIRLEYDAIKEPTSVIDSAGTVAYGSQFGATFGLGVNVGVGDNTVLSLEGSTAQFRDNIEMYTLVANIRYRF